MKNIDLYLSTVYYQFKVEINPASILLRFVFKTYKYTEGRSNALKSMIVLDRSIFGIKYESNIGE